MVAMAASPGGALLSPATQRRGAQLDASSRRIAKEQDERNSAEARPRAAVDVVYASAVTGKSSLEAVIQLGTVGLQILRRGGGGSRSGPIRTLAYSGVRSHEVMPLRKGVHNEKLTRGMAAALVVQYRDSTEGTRVEKIFCFLGKAEAEVLGRELTLRLQQLKRTAADAAGDRPCARSTEQPAALVAVMTSKTKARIGAQLWAKMSPLERVQAVQIMTASFSAVTADASGAALQSLLREDRNGKALSALSPSPRAKRSASAKRGAKKSLPVRRSARIAPHQSPARSPAAAATGPPQPVRIFEYVDDRHGSCAAF